MLLPKAPSADSGGSEAFRPRLAPSRSLGALILFEVFVWGLYLFVFLGEEQNKVLIAAGAFSRWQEAAAEKLGCSKSIRKILMPGGRGFGRRRSPTTYYRLGVGILIQIEIEIER